MAVLGLLMALALASSKTRAYYYNIGISVGETDERGCV